MPMKTQYFLFLTQCLLRKSEEVKMKSVVNRVGNDCLCPLTHLAISACLASPCSAELGAGILSLKT